MSVLHDAVGAPATDSCGEFPTPADAGPSARPRTRAVAAGKLRVLTTSAGNVPPQRLDAALRALIDVALRQRPSALDSGAENWLCVSTTPAFSGGRRT